MPLPAGRWKDRQVVPEAWAKERKRTWSPSSRSGDGYPWWTGLGEERANRMQLPPGGYWAEGHEGQCIVIDPADDLVVVHQTDGTQVDGRQMGQLMGLLLSAAQARR